MSSYIAIFEMSHRAEVHTLLHSAFLKLKYIALLPSELSDEYCFSSLYPVSSKSND